MFHYLQKQIVSLLYCLEFHVNGLSVFFWSFFFTDLAGTNNWESALVNVVAEMISDLKKPFSDKVFFEKDEAKKVRKSPLWTL